MKYQSISIRLSDTQEDQISILLKSPENRGVTKSQLIRYLLDLGLFAVSTAPILEEIHRNMSYQIKERP